MHWILLPLGGSPQRARQVAQDLAWLALERGWSPQGPLLALHGEAVVSVSSLDPLRPPPLIPPES